MKILLLQLNYDAHIIHPPLNLGYLASFLKRAGHQAEIFDGTLHRATGADYADCIATQKPDLVGISVMSRGHNMAKNLVSLIKKDFSLPVVIGGPQVSSYPEKILSDFKADYCVVGEGEETISELMDALEGKRTLDSVRGIAYFKNGDIRRTSPRPLVDDLDTLPMPAWDLMPPSQYRIAPILAPAKAFPVAPILTTRGCPYQCTFCATNVTWGNKLRKRSIANVVDEIETLITQFQVKEIHLSDDNFTFSRQHVENFCRELKNRGIHIPWQCPNGVRIDTLNRDLLKTMKEAGCYALGLGIESASPVILKKVKKNLDLSVVRTVLADMKKIGIFSYGFFILGLPGETRETIQETIDFALKQPFDRVWFNVLTPYPGSEIFGELLKTNRILFDDIPWDALDGNTQLTNMSALESHELEDFQKRAVKEFYTRPRVMFDVMRRWGPKEIKTLLMTRFLKKFGK